MARSPRYTTAISVVALVLMLVLLFTAGCAQPSRKPVPPPTRPAPSAPAPRTPAPARKPLPTTPAEVHRLASKLAADAATVPGVDKATVALTDSTALVGLDVKAGVEAARANSIKREVSDRLQRSEPRLTRVLVTTDPDLTARIKKIAEGVKAGKPVSSFSREVTELMRRLTPTAPK